MKQKDTLALYEESQRLADAMNSLDYQNSPTEDLEFEKCLNQMDNITKALNGDISALREVNKSTFHLQ